jgi:hypothetical protein
MSWDRAPVAKALAEAITTQLDVAGLEATVLDRPTFTVNPPAVVIGRPSELSYGIASFGIDSVTLPVLCMAGAELDDAVAELIEVVRDAVTADPTLGGVVAIAYATGERAWRNINVSGADYLAAEAVLAIEM